LNQNCKSSQKESKRRLTLGIVSTLGCRRRGVLGLAVGWLAIGRLTIGRLAVGGLSIGGLGLLRILGWLGSVVALILRHDGVVCVKEEKSGES